MASAAAPLPEPYAMSPQEIARGFLVGGKPIPLDPHPPTPSLSPIAALEAAILPALQQSPCLVEFSGGRDSSLMLAISLALARREGLPEPVAYTQRFPGLPEADENEWQERVAAHLGVTEWQRHNLTDELDLLGDSATTSLRHYGVVWPPMAHTKAYAAQHAHGGAVITGEGGDEILGPRRLSSARAVATRRVPWNRHSFNYAALAVAPIPLRRLAMRRLYERQLGTDWLTERASHELHRALAAESAAEPLDWRKALQRHLSSPAVVYGMGTVARLAADGGVEMHNPLLSPQFVDAVCRAGGRRGYLSRTAAMRALFGHLLPDEVLARTSKADFGRAVFGPQCRAFVDSWDGSGVNPDWVNANVLRSVWQTEKPHAMTHALLQSCWLQSRSPGV
jgi:asparagine synthetase B (glutamine-hydrolysing)